MSHELQVFRFEERSIRMDVDDNGNPWWVAKDVCEALGIIKNRDAVSRLRGNVTRPLPVDGVEMTAISEPGLYQLVLKSRKPSAEKFQDWITNEILPSIRKTGSYSIGEANPRIRTIPAAEPVFKALTSVAEIFGLEGNQARLYANKATLRETGIDFQNVLQIDLKSTTQERCFTPTELGARLGMSAVKFNQLLESRGFQQKRDGVWCATEVGRTFSVLLDAGKKHSDGTPIQQLKWRESILMEVELKTAQ